MREGKQMAEIVENFIPSPARNFRVFIFFPSPMAADDVMSISSFSTHVGLYLYAELSWSLKTSLRWTNLTFSSDNWVFLIIIKIFNSNYFKAETTSRFVSRSFLFKNSLALSTKWLMKKFHNWRRYEGEQGHLEFHYSAVWFFEVMDTKCQETL